MIRRLIILLLIVGCVFAQQYNVVVILQNGSEIHGIIIEEKPNEYIKIQSGKNVFVFEFEEIELLTKELVKDKTWSFAGGFGTNRSLSLLGISKDFRIGNNFSFFLTAGIGTAMPGLGFTYQSDYNNNGINFSATTGLQHLDETRNSFNSALNYQWKLNNNLFISLGIMGGMFWDNYDVCNTSSSIYNKTTRVCNSISTTEQYILPTISFDFRL
ncbi:uncharacterized protein METZ01_LOCUS487028 [marine metagenome]|uniref:Outer membrane protein beta-barrel domain-containing protein n=1 Tax=marine metagenome TaxID=408172 RepID=A0A383CPX6_9ZZZZ